MPNLLDRLNLDVACTTPIISQSPLDPEFYLRAASISRINVVMLAIFSTLQRELERVKRLQHAAKASSIWSNNTPSLNNAHR